jgi:prepilin-type N-terminal cleavage/methylation domain-containing protein
MKISFREKEYAPAFHTRRGFTLIEVMVTVVILSLGAVLLYSAFFTSLDSFNYCVNYVKVIPWMDEKVWQAQDFLSHFNQSEQLDREGEFKNGNKNFNWRLFYNQVDELQGLYKIALTVFWRQGQRTITVSRTAYALYQQKQ